MSAKEQSRYFSPGQNMTIREHWRRPASPQYDGARVSIPGRLHFGVLDFSKMAPGFGGGGLGISTDTVRHEVVIERTAPADGGCDIPSGEHLLALFKACIGYRANDIRITRGRSIEHTHSGFGSNVSFNTGVMAGLNAICGSPFAPDELWAMVTQNYVENAGHERQLYFGLDTGVGEACALYGGLVWIDASHGQGRYVGSVSTDGLWAVTAVGDRVQLTGEILRKFGEGAALADKTEADLVVSHFMDCEKRYGKQFKAFIHERMCPALLRNDIDEVLALGWEMNRLSNMKVLEGIYRTDVLRALGAEMRAQGALYAGMSSAGPGFFAFAGSEQQAHSLREYLESRFADYFAQAAVGRAGGKLRIDLQTPAQGDDTRARLQPQ